MCVLILYVCGGVDCVCGLSVFFVFFYVCVLCDLIDVVLVMCRR